MLEVNPKLIFVRVAEIFASVAIVNPRDISETGGWNFTGGFNFTSFADYARFTVLIFGGAAVRFLPDRESFSFTGFTFSAGRGFLLFSQSGTPALTFWNFRRFFIQR